MVNHTLIISSLAALAASAQAQTFTGDGTAYTLGSVSSGNCNFMAAPASASTNYAALNNPQWDSLKNCGRCAQVSCVDSACADKTISEIVHIVDRCPECKSGDLDLSPTVFKKITGSSPSRLKIKWQFVDCPSEGNLKYCLKSGSNPYFVAVQPADAGSGIASMKINGQATTMVDSAFYYVLNSQSPVDLSAVKVSLTSTSGATVEETLSLTAGSCTAGKSQFGGGSATTPPATTPKATSTPAATPKSTPKPTSATTPKPTTTLKPTTTPKKTPKPTKTPKVTSSPSTVGADSTPAPAPSSASGVSTPTPASASGDGDEYATPAPASASGDDEETTPEPSSVLTPAPAPASASGDDEYATPAPVSTTVAPASASGDDEYATPAPASGSNATTTSPATTPAMTPKKTSKPSNCMTKSEKQKQKEQKKKEKAAKKEKKNQQKKMDKKTSGAKSSTTTSAPAPAAYGL